jgi:hypothetical protein
MNPLAPPKYAIRLISALAATAGIFLATGCSSSNTTAPNNQGFTNSSLTGTYVFSSSGVDPNFILFDVVGALVADGKGGIGSGTMDVISAAAVPTSPVAQGITGSYVVNTDGRGLATVSSLAGTFTFDFVLSSGSHGQITEFDGHATGSGSIDLQTAVPSLTQLAGPYAFSLSGLDVNSNPLDTAGSFTLTANGTSSAGVQDFNDNAIPFPAQNLTAVATVGSGTGPGTLTLTSTFGQLLFDYYPIDATHLKVLETDYTNAILSGDVFTQTGASIPNGPTVFTMAGGTASSGPVASGGLMMSNGTGNFTSGLEDVNIEGSFPPAQVPFSGAAASGGSVGGRVVVNLTDFVPAAEWVIYPSVGGLVMLEMDEVNMTMGAAYAQTATSFAASEGYGLLLAGEYVVGAVSDIAQFNASSPASSPNMSGILDENVLGTPVANLSLSGTYTPDSPATGRGEIVVPSIGTANGELSLVYYVVDGSTVNFIELDNQQVAAGTFQLQNSSADGPAMAGQSRISVLHPLVRAHGAFRHK